MTLAQIQTFPFILLKNYSEFLVLLKGKFFEWFFFTSLAQTMQSVHLSLSKNQVTVLLPLPRSCCLFLTHHRPVCQSRAHTHKGHHVAWNELSDSTDDKLSFCQLRRVNRHSSLSPSQKATTSMKTQANGTETIHTNASTYPQLPLVQGWNSKLPSMLPMYRAVFSWEETGMLLGLTTALQPQEDGLRGGSTAAGQGEWLTWSVC